MIHSGRRGGGRGFRGMMRGGPRGRRGRGRGGMQSTLYTPGQKIIVTGGTNKGLIGKIKSCTDSSARVELHTKNRIVSIKIADIKEYVPKPSGRHRRGERERDQGSTWEGGKTPIMPWATPRDTSMEGGRTPGQSDGGMTPHAGMGTPYGDATPAGGDDEFGSGWDPMTPRHQAPITPVAHPTTPGLDDHERIQRMDQEAYGTSRGPVTPAGDPGSQAEYPMPTFSVGEGSGGDGALQDISNFVYGKGCLVLWDGREAVVRGHHAGQEVQITVKDSGEVQSVPPDQLRPEPCNTDDTAWVLCPEDQLQRYNIATRTLKCNAVEGSEVVLSDSAGSGFAVTMMPASFTCKMDEALM